MKVIHSIVLLYSIENINIQLNVSMTFFY